MSATEPSPTTGDPNEIADEETICRFLFDRDHFRAADSLVHWRGFLPRKIDTDLSVNRISGLEQATIWATGDEVGRPRNRAVLARGDFEALRAKGLGFSLKRVEPPIGHAHLSDWPADDEGARRTLAMRLAAIANLRIR